MSEQTAEEVFISRVFFAEIAEQCQTALVAYDSLVRIETEFDDAMRQYLDASRAWHAKLEAWITGDEEGPEPERPLQPSRGDLKVFERLCLSAFVTATANVSKFLFPPRPKDATLKTALYGRAERLRTELGILENSILNPNQGGVGRELRNALEHFNERLEEWVRDSMDHNVIRVAGPSDSIRGVQVIDVIYGFNLEDMTITLFGKQYPLPPLLEIIQELAPKVLAASKRGVSNELS